MIHISDFLKRNFKDKWKPKPHAYVKSPDLMENPFKKFEIEPEYYALDGTILQFCIFVLEGYLWEAKNTQHFMARHPELTQVHALLTHMMWLRDNEQFWPAEDEWLQLAFVDFARLVPALWD